MRSESARKGFTLIEMLIITGVMAMVASSMVAYSSSGRAQINLATETSKLAQLIIRAKSLAIATYGADSSICGYGIEFDYANRLYRLVAYSFSPNCESANPIISNRSVMEKHSLVSGISISQSAAGPVTDILFAPPDPTVLSVDNSGGLNKNTGGAVQINRIDGLGSKTVSVGSSGQITF